MESDIYNSPSSEVQKNTAFCRECGAGISRNATSCPKCGAPQFLGGRSKVAAGILAIFLGGFGMHRFYLGQWWGIFYLLLFWTWIPGLIAFVEGIVFLVTSDEKWNLKYGSKSGSSVLVLVLVSFFVIIPIIGILAAIAIPAYQDYTQRAQQMQIERIQK